MYLVSNQHVATSQATAEQPQCGSEPVDPMAALLAAYFDQFPSKQSLPTEVTT